MLSEERLAELEKENAERRQRKEAATPGPWESVGPTVHAGMCYVCRRDGVSTRVASLGNSPASAKTMAFITSARNDPVEDQVDEMIAEVKRSHKEVEFYKRRLGDLDNEIARRGFSWRWISDEKGLDWV